MKDLDSATLELLVWTFGSLLFFLFTTVTAFLVKLLSSHNKSIIQHELRISSLEEDVDCVNETLYPVNYRKPRKK